MAAMVQGPLCWAHASSPALCCLQGVKLLSYLYQEALDNCSNEHYPVLLSLLKTSCEPYTRWVWGRGQGGVPHLLSAGVLDGEGSAQSGLGLGSLGTQLHPMAALPTSLLAHPPWQVHLRLGVQRGLQRCLWRVHDPGEP